MALHPTILADLTAAAGKAPYYLPPLPEAREQVEQACLGKLPPVAVAAVRELAVPGPAGEIPVRVYTPFVAGLSGGATHPGRPTACHSAGAPQRSHGRKPEETQ